MKIRYLSKREIKRLVNRLEEELNIAVKPDRVKAVSLKKGELLIGRPIVLIVEGILIPFLGETEIVEKLPKVVVDMGAVPYVARGANVMRPGIVKILGNVGKGGLVSVVDEKYGKALAIGTLEIELEEFEKIKKGVVVKNLHYIGDEFWETAKELNVL